MLAVYRSALTSASSCSRSVVIGRVLAGDRMGEITLADLSSGRKRTGANSPFVSRKSLPSPVFQGVALCLRGLRYG